MIPRHISAQILSCAKEYPLLALVGPRQSGKTTLVKLLFPKYNYLSLENLDLRQQASRDPRGFLKTHGSFLILDEVQRVPELFSYLQELVDNNQEPGQYILTGSSQFLLMEKITQSLAGRIATLKLYPLNMLEIYNYPPESSCEDIFHRHNRHRPRIDQEELYRLLWMGCYPRVYDKRLNSHRWFENYVLTYIERDVRLLLNVRNIRVFEQFLTLCAAHSAQLINHSNFSNMLGMSVPTIKEWISILETSGVIFILPPYFQNYSKRIVKTPKLFFTDTGLLCYLLSIRTVEQLKTHPLLGAIFENFIIAECFKRFYNLGEKPPLFFWRDQSGNEIDLLIHHGQYGSPFEIKLSQTYHPDFNKNIDRWLHLKGNSAQKGYVIYCGEHPASLQHSVSAIPWYTL